MGEKTGVVGSSAFRSDDQGEVDLTGPDED